jgi:hypothetical protein
VDGRTIHYHIADDNGDVEDDIERHSFTFNGSSLEELTDKLQEETGIDDLIVCTRSPINGKLTPLLLRLPPNNAAMHIVLVRESAKGVFYSYLLFATFTFLDCASDTYYFCTLNLSHVVSLPLRIWGVCYDLGLAGPHLRIRWSGILACYLVLDGI